MKIKVTMDKATKRMVPGRDIQGKTTVQSILRDIVLKNILSNYYTFETVNFGRYKEYRTSNGMLKVILKIMDCNYNLVSNDIHANYYSGCKFYFCCNTNSFKVFKKTYLAKPLSKFGLTYKAIAALSPKLKEFYNITGDTIGYKSYQFYNNKDYHYANDLKNLGHTRIFIFKTMLKMLTNSGLNFHRNIQAYQPYRRSKYRIYFTGFSFKLYKRPYRLRYKLKKLSEYHVKVERDFTRKIRRKRYKKVLFKTFRKKSKCF